MLMRKALVLTDVSGSDALYCSAKAEQYGRIESIWVPEMNRRDSVSILGAIAANTTKIKIATGIINVYSRTPALIAMSLMTLQELSNGRLLAGLSVGNPDYVRDIHGMTVTKSINRLREVVSIVRKTSSAKTESISHTGEIFTIRKWTPKFPASIDSFPIYVGAHNPKLLEFVGEACDGVILNLVSPENVKSAAKIIQTSATRNGREASSVDIASIVMIAVNDDGQIAEQRVRKQIAFYLSRSRQIRMRLGKSEFSNDIKMVDSLLIEGKQSEISERLSKNLIDSIAIYGTKNDVERRLLDYERSGLNLAMFYVAGWMGDARSFTDSLLSAI